MEKGASLEIMAWLWVCMGLAFFSARGGSIEGGNKKEVSRVKVYLHDSSLYKKASLNTATMAVPRSSTMSTASNKFGEMYVFDDILTSGPSMKSRPVGRAQGLYIYSGRVNASAFWAGTAFLGEKGSISFMGAELIFNPSPRVMPVVGGTGSFARSSGVVTISTLAAKFPNYFVLSLDFDLSL